MLNKGLQKLYSCHSLVTPIMYLLPSSLMILSVIDSFHYLCEAIGYLHAFLSCSGTANS